MKNYQNIIHEEFMQKNTHVITIVQIYSIIILIF
jgi:hypothetical protein